jgi:hypothetical protein
MPAPCRLLSGVAGRLWKRRYSNPHRTPRAEADLSADKMVWFTRNGLSVHSRGRLPFRNERRI